MMPQKPAQAGPSTQGLNPEESNVDKPVPKKQKSQGGGGADMHHGIAYHVGVVVLLLISLKNISQEDLGFQYEISLEKEGYGKFDDVVLKYKLSGGQWIELCIQCKHAADPNAKVTAEDFVGTKSKINKAFNLCQYIESFTNITSKRTKTETDIKRFFIIICNRQYDSSKNSLYPFFKRSCISSQQFSKVPQFLPGEEFTIEFNNDLMQNLKGKENLKESDYKEFFQSFVYICDTRNITEEITKMTLLYCNENQEASRNLESNLKAFVFDNLGNKTTSLNNQEIHQRFTKKQFSYNIPRLNDRFMGREEEVLELHKAFDSKGKKMLDVLVTGLPGVGKTQVVTKYMENNTSTFTNVIWINAESENTIETSFVDLAVKCTLTSSHNKQDISNIIETVYEYLSPNSVFIFDNADYFKIDNKILLKPENNRWCYLPNTKHETMKIVIISQNKQWDCTNTINVNCFSEEDALQYIKDAISKKCEYSDYDINRLTCKLNYWPLALSLVASYIKQEIEDSLVNIKLSDITNQIYENEEQFIHYFHDTEYMELYNKSLYTIWQLLKNKIQKKDPDGITIQILEVIAFTEPDCIPFNFLLSHYLKHKNITEFLKIATNYSIVSKHENSFSIHRTLQLIIRASFKKEKKAEVLVLGSTIVRQYLDSLDVYAMRQMSTNIHCIAIWNYILQSHDVFLKCYRNLKQISIKLEKSYDTIQGIKFLFEVVEKLSNTKEIEFDIKIFTNKSLSILLSSVGRCKEALDILDSVLNISKKQTNNSLEILETMQAKATVLSDFGRYHDALRLYDYVLNHRRELLGPNHLDTNTTVHFKASVLDSMGKYEDALILYNQVHDVRKDKLGADHPDTLTTMHNKALVLKYMGKFDEALSLYNQVLDVKREKLGADHPDTLTTMHNIASVLDSMGKYDDALSLYNQVFKVEKVKLGADHPSTLTTMHNKALVLKCMGKYNDALSLYNHVLEVEKVKLGADQPSTLTTMHSIASVLYKMGKYDDALSLYNQVLEVKKVKLGSDHPSTLTIMHNKALVLDSMGKYDDAMSLYNQVLEVRKVKLGADHPNTLTTMHNKALVLDSMGKYDDAMTLYDEVLEVRKLKLGDNHPDTLTTMHSIASVLNNMGKYDDALSLYNQVLEVEKVKLGADHPSTLTTMHNKASVLDRMGKYDDALSLYNQVLGVKREMLGADHPSTLTTMHNKALVLKCIGKYDDALSLYDEVLKVRKLQLGADHPDTLTTMHNKASVLDSMGKYDDAMTLYDEVLKVRKLQLGADHPHTLTTMHNKASVLYSMGKYDDAMTLYDEVLEVRKVQLGANHPSTLNTMHNRDLVFNRIGLYKDKEALILCDQVLEQQTDN